MKEQYITPLNLSKLGFRYFRVILESKMFSRKFIEYVVNHPNTGYVFEGTGWSGKKRVLGIGIWATTNAEITDIATHIRSVVPESYRVVYQSELTRLEYFNVFNGELKAMVLIDELEQKQSLSAIELEYLKLLSVDGSLSVEKQASTLNIDIESIEKIDLKLKNQGVFYGVLKNKSLSSIYTKYFVDTASLKNEVVESLYKDLAQDKNCVYLARGNGKYNIEIEYNVENEADFNSKYSLLLKNSKKINFQNNLFTNLFPQSKSLNTKAIQTRFVELANLNSNYFDFRDSALWYVNKDGVEGYLNIYSQPEYKEAMSKGEAALFKDVSALIKKSGKKYNLIDLGSGDGTKGKELISCIGEENLKAYFPVDIQELELAQVLRTHANAIYNIHPTFVNFNNLSSRFPLASSNNEINLIALMGGTYGNFAPKEINDYISEIIKSDSDKVLISSPIRDFTTKEDIQASYFGDQTEQVSFGVLKHIGFKKEDFVVNPKNPKYITQFRWDGNSSVIFFVLKQNKFIHGIHLESGTKFDVITSWKPTLSEFKQALEQDFEVEEMISNKAFAFAVCKKK